MDEKYLDETVDYGGEKMSRGEAYNDLVACAKSYGMDDDRARKCADRWMQANAKAKGE